MFIAQIKTLPSIGNGFCWFVRHGTYAAFTDTESAILDQVSGQTTHTWPRVGLLRIPYEFFSVASLEVER